MTISAVGVLGCGLMGSGIAQVCASSGYRTIVREVDRRALDRGMGRIADALDAAVVKGKLDSAARAAALQNLSGATSFADLAVCDLVIEAIVENVDEKRKTYLALEEMAKPTTIFVTNTSSLSVTELAAASQGPEQFAGLHFFNPVPVMKLVEVIRGLATSDETYQAVRQFGQSLGKEVISAPDRPGFIVNRLFVPYLLGAIRAYEQGLGTLEDIDTGMRLGCGYPMGPFRLLDYVGLDTIYSVANIMFDEFRQATYAPPPLLKRLVLAGRLGRKTGHGFYKY
jgi:3-hydroxybutyryl-CoA dehydrogenase